MEKSSNSSYPLGFCPEKEFTKASTWFVFGAHIVGILTFISGIYCSKLMAKGLPESLGYFKTYLNFYHITSTTSAVFISSITTPVYYFPLYAGYNVGLLNYLKVPFPYQCNLTLSIHFTYFSVCVILFFHRYWLVRSSNPNFEDWKYRFSTIVLFLVYPLPYFVVSYALVSPDRQIDSLVEACPAYKVLQTIDYSYNIGRLHNEQKLKIEMLIFSINASTLMVFLVIFKVLISRCLSQQQLFMSQKSLSMHRKILRTLELQSITPSSLLSCPSIIIIMTMLFDIPVSLDASHILIFATQLHGLANTAGIIVLNTNLLEIFLQDVLRLLRIKKLISLQNSQVLPSQSTASGVKKSETTQTADAF